MNSPTHDWLDALLSGVWANAYSVDEAKAEIVSELTKFWRDGFRDHRDGILVCEHGYEKGDHHWESGNCLALTRSPATAVAECTVCRYPLSSARVALRLRTCSGPCNAAYRDGMAER